MFVKIDGKKLAEYKLAHLQKLIAEGKEKMKLAIIQIGDDEPSNIYIKNKIARANEIGIYTELHRFPSGSFLSVEDKILELNQKADVTGLMIQTPLVGIDNFSEQLSLINMIDPVKDVDGLTSRNLGELSQIRDFNYLDTEKFYIPATVLSIIDSLVLGILMKILKIDFLVNYESFLEYKSFFYEAKMKFLSDQLKKKNILIINDSSILGRPLSMLLTTLGATVTVAHIFTPNVQNLIDNFDIVITGVGKAGIWKVNNMIKNNYIIDAGITSLGGRTLGDFNINQTLIFDLKELEKVANVSRNGFVIDTVFVTPVPGGVGPLTIQNLLENVRKANNFRI